MSSITIEAVRETVSQLWGYDSFRPLQQEAIEAVLADRDTVVILPTGGGKSLCFQAPACCLDGLAVVVSPLISLMKDQVDALRTNGIAAAYYNSSLSAAERSTVIEAVRCDALKLLYLAPESLLNENMLDLLGSVPVSMVAIDEAHCISSWGHDFRPEYRGLQTLKQRFPGVAVHAYTATATERVRHDIAAQLGLDEPEMLVGSFDRPNLNYRVQRRARGMDQMLEVIERHKNECIVYCISRKEVERTAEALNALGHSALPYHAGLSAKIRMSNQEAFLEERINIVVATVAFGMGIDKSNVRFVIHSGMPKSLEAYQQESGRARWTRGRLLSVLWGRRFWDLETVDGHVGRGERRGDGGPASDRSVLQFDNLPTSIAGAVFWSVDRPRGVRCLRCLPRPTRSSGRPAGCCAENFVVHGAA